MSIYDDFVNWLMDEANAPSRAWAERYAASRDPRVIFRTLATTAFVADDPAGTKPFSLRSIEIFRFFPQIEGFRHRTGDDDNTWQVDPVRGDLEILKDLPGVHDLCLATDHPEFPFSPRGLRQVRSLKIVGPWSGELGFLAGWEGLQRLDIDTLPSEFLPPPYPV